MPVLDAEALIEDRLNRIRQYHHNVQIVQAELDVSGGVDSAVMLGLLVRALGADRVTAVYQGIHSSQESLERAREVAQTFGVKLIEINLTSIYENLIREMERSIGEAARSGCSQHWAAPDLNGDEAYRKAVDEVRSRCDADPTILGSIRSCIRAPIGRGFNRMTGGGIRHGTGNECEDRWLRFYQKGGDGEVDCNPIAMLSKGEVYQLGVALGVPKSILSATPTPDLWGTGEGHNDEDELKSWLGVDFTYSWVDPETGEYTYVGSIERVSRVLDIEHPVWGNVEGMLFGKAELDLIVNIACNVFPKETDREDILAFLKAARKVERITRHKMNPNCPMLGSREDLLTQGILTNDLPNLKG